MGTNANGYEIRLQLLQMAKDMLFDQWHAQEHVRSSLPAGEVDVDVPAEAIMNFRSPPSPTDIQALAMELYGFVQRKDAPLRNPSIPDDHFGT